MGNKINKDYGYGDFKKRLSIKESLTDLKFIDLKEFVDEGYLQELNRQFLHPLGMALVVTQFSDNKVDLLGITDYRDDPEGCVFGKSLSTSREFILKANNVIKIQQEKLKFRKKTLGYDIEPL